MGLPIPPLRSSCCCCCAGGGFTAASLGALPDISSGAASSAAARRAPGGGGSADLFRLSNPAAVEVAAPGFDVEGPLGWRKRPVEGKKYRVPVALYDALTRARAEPVRSVNRCGVSRDCVPGEGTAASFSAAMRNVRAWNALGGGRFVELYEQKSGVFLGEFHGSSTDYVEFLSDKRDEREMQLIQYSPNAGRFGFLPP